MAKDKDDDVYSAEDHDRCTEALPFLLGGLQGRTNGNEIIGITLQRDDSRAFRIVLRGRQVEDDGTSVRVVAFTNSDDPAECLLLAEAGYRDATARWHVDKYAESRSDSNKPKSGAAQLVLMD